MLVNKGAPLLRGPGHYFVQFSYGEAEVSRNCHAYGFDVLLRQTFHQKVEDSGDFSCAERVS